MAFVTAVSRPHTPPVKRVSTNWYGLPSPQTPSDAVEGPADESVALAGFGSEKQFSRSAEILQRTYSRDRAVSAYSRLETPGTLGTPVSPSVSTTGATEGSTLPDCSPAASSTSVDADAEFVLELSSPSSVRRSTRLRNKPKSQGKPAKSSILPCTLTKLKQ